jgi:hypothetical protein
VFAVTLDHETEAQGFFIFQSVSRANASNVVNMNASPLGLSVHIRSCRQTNGFAIRCDFLHMAAADVT